MSRETILLPDVPLPPRYGAISALGQGGSGRVLRVHDREYDRDVALKIVGPKESEWLRREFDTLRSIRHENLIHVFEWGVLTSGDAYYTMELVDCGDLGSQLDRYQDETELRRLLTSALRGLGHLHCHGEIHGDLKPGNILLGRGGVVKVTDIGMGTSLRSSSSGTPGYTAPEAWMGDHLTTRSDIYSVGVIAYEALTGNHPFGARTIREVIAGQVEGWVPSIRSHGISTSQELERAVMRAMEKDPELRHGSADEFLDAIGEGGVVGEILGGRFVGRAAERAQLANFALSDEAGAASLLYVCGPRGIGKSALVAETIASNARIHAIARTIYEPEHDLSDLAGLGRRDTGKPADGADAMRVSNVADALKSRFEGTGLGLFAIEDPPAIGDLVRRVARYSWAESTERRGASKVRFIKVAQSPPESLEPFEALLTLSPFDADAAAELMTGILGQVEPHPTFSKRLVDEVGGSPQSLTVAILELVDRGLITRRYGRWRVGDIPEQDWVSLRTNSSHWQRTWGRLSSAERDALTAISLVQRGLNTEELGRVFPTVDVAAIVSRLQASGWAALHESRFRPSSREAARVALSLEHDPETRRIRGLVLGTIADRLSRPDRASLLVDSDVTPEAVSEGLWYARECRAGGQYGQALRVLARVREMAKQTGDSQFQRAAALLAAEILYQSGAANEALALLGTDDEWISVDADSNSIAQRAMLRGLSFKFLRELDLAKRQFEICAAAAVEAGDSRLVMHAGAELAEIDWRHGGEAGRERAVKRVNELIAQPTSGEFQDELAALQYQLGASLVMAGKREAAVTILEDALKKAGSCYWQMRLSNALSSAHYYLGNLRAALSASERAWRHAVEGEIDSFKPRILASMAGVQFGLGMFREAAEQDEMAAFWGRRVGNPFEYEAGLLAASSDFIHIAAFERALAAASEVRRVAHTEPPSRHVAKAFEIEALTHIHVGDYASAQGCVARADSIMSGRGFDDLVPRLRWHEGRIEMERGDFSAAEAKLAEALDILEQTRDWEDLPGVQVEMQLLFARAGDDRLDPKELRRLLDDARRGELVIVQLRATLALAEVAGLDANLLGDTLPMMAEGLRLGEKSGAREFVWRLSYWAARALAGSGDRRGAVARMSTGIRVLREVASELTPQHRSSYLATSHARLLLSDTQLGI